MRISDPIQRGYSEHAEAADPLTLNEVVRLVARLGGFLARTGDGEPGVKTLWLVMQRILDFAADIRFLRELQAQGLAYNARLSPRLPNQALRRNTQPDMQAPHHRHGQLALTVKHLVHPV